MAPAVWMAYLAACLAISVSPGPGAFASMASGMRNGFFRGYWVVVGLQVGLVAVLAVVAAGVGTLITSSQTAFEILRWAGVAYLAWLGIAQWRSDGRVVLSIADSAKQSRTTLLLRGFLIDVSNPKALLFLLAVVPQFLDLSRPLVPQYLILGATMVSVDMVIMAGYTLLAVRTLHFLESPRHLRFANRAFGLIFIAAAFSLALFRRHAN